MRGRGGWGRARLTYKKKFCQFRLSESLFFVFLYILCTASCRTCDCVRMRTYLPNYGYLFEKTSSANKKYTYRKIDTHYCGQTASTTPSGVKAYVAQSNPLHSTLELPVTKIEIFILPMALTGGVFSKFRR